MDEVDSIIAFENGELEEDDVISLFQRLLNSGLVWSLQGSYQRTCIALLEEGLITPPQTV